MLVASATTVFSRWRDSLRGLLIVYEQQRHRRRGFIGALFLIFVAVNIICFWVALATAFWTLIPGSGTYYLKLQIPVGLLGACFDLVSLYFTVAIVKRALKTRGNLEYIAHLSLDLALAVAAMFWVLFVFTFSGWLVRTMGTPETTSLSLETSTIAQGSALTSQPVRTVPQASPPPTTIHQHSALTAESEGTVSKASLPTPTIAELRAKTQSERENQTATLRGRADAYQELVLEAIRNPTQNLRYVAFGGIMGISACLPTGLHVYLFLVSLLRQFRARERGP